VERDGTSLRSPIIDGYIRVSRVGNREGESFQSPATQEAAIRRWAKENNFTIGEMLTELDVSGKLRAQDRGLETLILRAERGESAGIACQYLDRLTRGRLAEAASIWERLRDAHARFVATDDGIDSENEGAELFFAIRAALAREQWKSYAKKWEIAKATARARGAFMARTPTGYDRTESSGLEPNSHGALVASLYDQRLLGGSYAELVAYAATQGLLITVTGIRKLLSNRVYIGDSDSGPSPALVSLEVFDGVQAKIRTRKAPNAVAKTLSQGLARCANCGSMLLVTRTSTGDIFYCRGLRVGGCNQRGCVSTRILDDYVTEQFLSAFDGDGPLARASANASALAETEKLRREAAYELEQLSGSTSLISTLGIGRYEKMVEGASGRLQIAEQAHAQAAASATTLSTVAKMLDRWDGLDLADKRFLLASAVERIEVGKGRRPVERKARLIFAGGVVVGAPDDAGALLVPVQ
jgi:DNA invertase Pin-like site-specific DNA recombinase